MPKRIKPIEGIPKQDMLILQKYLFRRFGAFGYEVKTGINVPPRANELIDIYFYESNFDGLLYPRDDLEED